MDLFVLLLNFIGFGYFMKKYNFIKNLEISIDIVVIWENVKFFLLLLV